MTARMDSILVLLMFVDDDLEMTRLPFFVPRRCDLLYTDMVPTKMRLAHAVL